MKVQIVQAVGVVYTRHIRWFDEKNVCTSSTGHHEAERVVTQAQWDTKGDDSTYPTHCDQCQRAVPTDQYVSRWGCGKTNYDTPDGKLKPGDAYWRIHALDEYCQWSNCDGRHLMVTMLDGSPWDVMSRASNCDMKEDKLHRCWVAHVNDGVIHVDKAGLTCNAGAGSIIWGDYHGFLHNGELTGC